MCFLFKHGSHYDDCLLSIRDLGRLIELSTLKLGPYASNAYCCCSENDCGLMLS